MCLEQRIIDIDIDYSMDYTYYILACLCLIIL